MALIHLFILLCNVFPITPLDSLTTLVIIVSLFVTWSMGSALNHVATAMGLDVELSNYLMLMAGTPYLADRSFIEDPAKSATLHTRLAQHLARHNLTLPKLIQAVSLT